MKVRIGGNSLIKKCPECGKEFEVLKRIKSKKYCSPECTRKAYKRELRARKDEYQLANGIDL